MKILHLPWEKAKTITTGVASNYFAHFLSERIVINQELQLERDRTKPTLISLTNWTTESEDDHINKVFSSNWIAIDISLVKLENNPELTDSYTTVSTSAKTENTKTISKVEYFLNKITLNYNN